MSDVLRWIRRRKYTIGLVASAVVLVPLAAWWTVFYYSHVWN